MTTEQRLELISNTLLYSAIVQGYVDLPLNEEELLKRNVHFKVTHLNGHKYNITLHYVKGWKYRTSTVYGSNAPTTGYSETDSMPVEDELTVNVDYSNKFEVAEKINYMLEDMEITDEIEY